jgi:hypothetical protein
MQDELNLPQQGNQGEERGILIRGVWEGRLSRQVEVEKNGVF